MNKQIYVKNSKWKKFKKICFNNDSTIKKEIDKFLDRFIKENE